MVAERGGCSAPWLKIVCIAKLGEAHVPGPEEAVIAVADVRRLAPAQIALAWLLGKAAVSAPIVGAAKPQHLENAIASIDVTLSEAEVKRLEAPCRPHPILGHD